MTRSRRKGNVTCIVQTEYHFPLFIVRALRLSSTQAQPALASAAVFVSPRFLRVTKPCVCHAIITFVTARKSQVCLLHFLHLFSLPLSFFFLNKLIPLIYFIRMSGYNPVATETKYLSGLWKCVSEAHAKETSCSNKHLFAQVCRAEFKTQREWDAENLKEENTNMPPNASTGLAFKRYILSSHLCTFCMCTFYASSI